MFILLFNVHSECTTSLFTTSIPKPAGLNFMAVYTQGSPTHGCCLLGQHQAEIRWVGM